MSEEYFVAFLLGMGIASIIWTVFAGYFFMALKAQHVKELYELRQEMGGMDV